VLPPRIDSPTRRSLSTNSRPIRLLASRASFHFLWWGIAFIKGLAASVSLAKDTLGGSCRNSACLDHPVIKFFGVFSRPAMWVFHPLGRVATEIRAPHPRCVQGVIDVLAPLTRLSFNTSSNTLCCQRDCGMVGPFRGRRIQLCNSLRSPCASTRGHRSLALSDGVGSPGGFGGFVWGLSVNPNWARREKFPKVRNRRSTGNQHPRAERSLASSSRVMIG
jgi:hypothetical protein